METQYVWIPYDGAWAMGSVRSMESDDFTVSVEGKIQRIKKDKCLLVTEQNSVVIYNDMIEMTELHEALILNNLTRRYAEDKIYTYIGPMIVSINPFKKLDIYDTLQPYQIKSRDSLPPHLYAIGQKAYSSLVEQGESQSMVISGESGAGKTEATKYILRYLSHVASANSSTSDQDALSKRILATNPILEAFGNAKTQRNDNSSRFGKFIKISLSKQGVYLGASINNYLLEKTRVVFQAPTERNYHVFYQILHGASSEERQRYHLLDSIEDYSYMTNGDIRLSHTDDVADFDLLKKSFSELGIGQEELSQYFTLLSAILLIGNVDFEGEDQVSIVKPDLIKTISQLLEIPHTLLAEILTHRSLVTTVEKCIKIPLRADQAAENRDALAKALYFRLFDRLVKRCNDCIGGNKKYPDSLFIGVLDIYGFEDLQENSMEQFCINYANEKLHHQFIENMFKAEQEQYQKEKVEWTNIDFVDNQACIHLIEKNGGILSMMDEEGKVPKGNDKTLVEKLCRKHRSCSSFCNDDISPDYFGVKHYASTVHYNILGFMEKNKDTLQDDVCIAMSQSRCPLIRDLFVETPSTPTSPRGGTSSPRRLSREVTRSPESPMQKEKELCIPPLNLSSIVPSIRRAPTTGSLDRKLSGTISRSFGPVTARSSRVMLSPLPLGGNLGASVNGEISSPRTNSDKGVTVCRKFQNDLISLIDILSTSNRHYIRCLKPNDSGTPNCLNPNKILNQLRSNGILETIKLRQAGYNRRLSFTSFCDRYFLLGCKQPTPSALVSFLRTYDIDIVEPSLLSPSTRVPSRLSISSSPSLPTTKRQWAVGLTQVFLRDGLSNRLEADRSRYFQRSVLVFQKHVRCYNVRGLLEELEELMRVKLFKLTQIQTWVRGWEAKRLLQRLLELDAERKRVAAVVLQRLARLFLASEHAKHIKRERDKKYLSWCYSTCQAHVRRYNATESLQRMREMEKSVVIVQKYVRICKAYTRLRTLKEEAECKQKKLELKRKRQQEEEERCRRESEDRLRHEQELRQQLLQQAEEQQKRKAMKELRKREEEQRRQEEEQSRRCREEEEHRRRQEEDTQRKEEQRRFEEEQRRYLEQLEQRRRDDEQKRRREEEDNNKRRLEEEKRRREEENRIREEIMMQRRKVEEEERSELRSMEAKLEQEKTRLAEEHERLVLKYANDLKMLEKERSTLKEKELERQQKFEEELKKFEQIWRQREETSGNKEADRLRCLEELSNNEKEKLKIAKKTLKEHEQALLKLNLEKELLQKDNQILVSKLYEEEKKVEELKLNVKNKKEEMKKDTQKLKSKLEVKRAHLENEKQKFEEQSKRLLEEQLVQEKRLQAQIEEDLKHRLDKVKNHFRQEKERLEQERAIQEQQQAQWLKYQRELIEEQYSRSQQDTDGIAIYDASSPLQDKLMWGVLLGGVGIALWGLSKLVSSVHMEKTK